MNEMDPPTIARNFLTLVIEGKIDEAYERYIDIKGKHHNAYFSAGFENLKKAMKENEAQFPHKQFTIHHLIGERDMVVAHSHLIMKKGEVGLVTIHMFRIEGDKIVELWDCGQQLPADSPNTDGLF